MNIKKRISNIRAMADNLMKCPCSEMFLSQAFATQAQALRDIAQVLEELNTEVDKK